MDLSLIPSYAAIQQDLHRDWEDVLSQQAMRLVLLEGISGTDKTGIAKQFAHTAHIPCVSGYGSEAPESYLTFRLLFESLVRLNEVQAELDKPVKEISAEWKLALTALARILPLLNLLPNPTWDALRHWLPTSETALIDDTLEADEEPHPVTLPDLVTLALGEVATLFPLIVLVDNLDQAGAATIDAFTMSVLPALLHSRVMVIVTHEPHDHPYIDEWAEFMQKVQAMPQTRALQVSSLEATEVAELLRDEIPTLDENRLVNIASQIHEGTEGILARAQDIVSWLKTLEPDTLAHLQSIPDHATWTQAQFERLPEKAQTFLTIAAVQGMYFCQEAVEQVSGEVSKPFLSNLLEAPFGFVTLDTTVTVDQRTLHWYHFYGRHIRQQVYTSIPEETRPCLHRDIALALEQCYGEESDTIAGVLAQHFEQGDMPEKAASYFALIARQANEQGAASEAQNYAQQGLKNWLQSSNKSPLLRCQLLLEEGHALKDTAKSYYAGDILREALEIAKANQSPQIEMEIRHLLGEILLSCNAWDEGIELLEQAIELAAKQKAWKVVIESMEHLRIRYRRRSPQAFLSLCDRMLTMVREDSSSEVPLVMAEILEDKAWTQYYQRKHSQALETLTQAFDYLKSLKNPERYPETYYKIHLVGARAFRLMQEYSKSLEEADKAIAWAYASHSRKNVAWARDAKAVTLRRMGSEYLEQGENEYKQILALLRSSSDIVTLATMKGSYGQFLSYSGHKRRARELYVQSYEYRLAVNSVYDLQKSRNNIAAIDKYLGSFQSALSEYQQLYNDGLAQGDISRQSISLNHIGDIYRISNRLDEAEKAHHQVVALCDEIDNLGRKAIALRRLGQAHLCGYRLSEARTSLNAAEALFQKKTAITLASHQENQIYLERLALCEGQLSSTSRLKEIIETLYLLHEPDSIGIGYMNLALAELIAGKPEEALTAATEAEHMLRRTETWRMASVHHLLARCHAAVGDIDRSRNEIVQAKQGFMDLGLPHRVFQAESTELNIQETQESGNLSRLSDFSQEELRYDFNHLGI